MQFKITENISTRVTLNDIEAMIKEHVRKEGYDVVKITPEYKQHKEGGSGYSIDPREYSTPVTIKEVTGFKVDLKRKSEPVKHKIPLPERDWFDINDR